MLQKILLFFLLIIATVSCKNSGKSIQDGEGKQISRDFFIHLDQERIEKKAKYIDDIFSRLYKKRGFNGTVVYAEKGKAVYMKAFGFETLQKKDSLSVHSAFQLASVSKIFTATAVMLLKEEKKLDYDVDIKTYLPEFPYDSISVRLLLNHRSGLPRYMSLAHDKWKYRRKPLKNKDMLDLFIEHKPKLYFTPNNGFHYCNTNYAILANIVERISGISFDKFVKIRIFDPLNMHDSFVYNMNGDSLVPAYIDQGVPGYRYSGWHPVKHRNEYLNGVMGDKGVYASVSDLFKFDQALYEEEFISDSTVREAFMPGSPKSKRRKDNYGFGWRIKNGDENTVYHYGWWKGFRAFYIRDMKQQKSIIVLCNRSEGPGTSFLWKIINNKDYDLGFSTRL